MLSNFPVGKTLTAIKMLEPWRQGTEHVTTLPLFGALILEFEDTAILFKSPLRYCRKPQGTLITGSDFQCADLGYRIILCDIEEARAQQSLLEAPLFNPLGLAWQSVFPALSGRAAWQSQYGIENVLWRRLKAASLVENHVAESSISPISAEKVLPAIELVFGDSGERLCITYREEMDGAIQLAQPGLNLGLEQIVITKPENAFGWLHDDAPYPVVMEGKRWNSVWHYLHSFDVELKLRAILKAAAPITEAHQSVLRKVAFGQIREMALQNKFRLNPYLARRLRALRYPVVQDASSQYRMPDREFLLSPIRESGFNWGNIAVS